MAVKIDKADAIFSKYIRKRDGRCMKCGLPVVFNAKGDPVSHQASHFQRRAKEMTRFDEENVDCLCEDCHREFTLNPRAHYAWQVQMKGQDKVNEIVLRSFQYKAKDREASYQYWRKRYKALW